MDTNTMTAQALFSTVTRYGRFVPKPLLVAAAVVALMVWCLYMTVTFFHRRRPDVSVPQSSRRSVRAESSRRVQRGGINYRYSRVDNVVAIRSRGHRVPAAV